MKVNADAMTIPVHQQNLKMSLIRRVHADQNKSQLVYHVDGPYG